MSIFNAVKQVNKCRPLHFCTSLGISSLPKLIALYWSLLRHSRSPFIFWVLGDGDDVNRLLLELNFPNVRLINISELETQDKDLLATKKSRDPFEYNCTLRPCWILYLLKNYPEIDFLTYMDTDLYFFADPKKLYTGMDLYSVTLSKHNLSINAKKMGVNTDISGIYNAGWLAFRQTEQSYRALEWWRDCCLEWCYRFYADGKFGEQKYLDNFPSLISDLGILRLGGNVAPWNIGNYEITIDNIGQVFIDQEQVIFYHFHALQMAGEKNFKVEKERGSGVIQLTNRGYKLSRMIKKVIYKPYLKDLNKSIDLVRSLQ
jgi:hypothetical protein